MALGTTIYNALFRKTSSMVLTMAIGAFAFEAAVDGASEYIFNYVNRGKLWNDIKHKYVATD